MQEILKAALAEIDAKKREIVTRTLALSESERGHSSGNQWSAAQVVEHLVMFEEYLQTGHNKAIEAGNSLKPGLKGKIFGGIVGSMVRAKIRFGTTKEFEPTLDIDLNKRLQDWNEIRETLVSALDEISALDLNETFAIHPIAGPLTAETTVRMISLHLDYHIRFFPGNPAAEVKST